MCTQGFRYRKCYIKLIEQGAVGHYPPVNNAHTLFGVNSQFVVCKDTPSPGDEHRQGDVLCGLV